MTYNERFSHARLEDCDKIASSSLNRRSLSWGKTGKRDRVVKESITSRRRRRNDAPEEAAVCLFVRFTAVSFQGPQDRCCEEIHRREREGGPGPSFPSFVLIFFHSGQEDGVTPVTITSWTECKTDNDDRKNDDRTRKSPNCVTRLLFVYIVRHAASPHRVIVPAFNREALGRPAWLSVKCRFKSSAGESARMVNNDCELVKSARSHYSRISYK